MYTLILAGPNHLDDLALLFDAYSVFWQKTDLAAAKKFLRKRITNNQSPVLWSTAALELLASHSSTLYCLL